MAFGLTRRRPLAKELARIVAKEFERTLGHVAADSADRVEGIHEARKSIKKIRAVVRLVRKDLGGAARVLNRQLRAIAHQLSPLRDVDATLEIMESLRAHYPRLVTSSLFARVHRGLVAWRRRALARLDPDRALARVARDIRRSATETPELIRRRVRGYASIRAGMTRGYRRARKAMASVQANPDDSAWHIWRRRVKDHWYHIRLLEGISATARRRARRLKRLETWLGDDHNLVLLRTTILSAPTQFGRDRTTAVVLGCIATYQTTLRRRTLRLGDRLFARRPKVFRQSVDGWWDTRRGAS
jgi:CHAD domain-containing protein